MLIGGLLAVLSLLLLNLVLPWQQSKVFYKGTVLIL